MILNFFINVLNLDNLLYSSLRFVARSASMNEHKTAFQHRGKRKFTTGTCTPQQHHTQALFIGRILASCNSTMDDKMICFFLHCLNPCDVPKFKEFHEGNLRVPNCITQRLHSPTNESFVF